MKSAYTRNRPGDILVVSVCVLHPLTKFYFSFLKVLPLLKGVLKRPSQVSEGCSFPFFIHLFIMLFEACLGSGMFMFQRLCAVPNPDKSSRVWVRWRRGGLKQINKKIKQKKIISLYE